MSSNHYRQSRWDMQFPRDTGQQPDRHYREDTYSSNCRNVTYSNSWEYRNVPTNHAYHSEQPYYSRDGDRAGFSSQPFDSSHVSQVDSHRNYISGPQSYSYSREIYDYNHSSPRKRHPSDGRESYQDDYGHNHHYTQNISSQYDSHKHVRYTSDSLDLYQKNRFRTSPIRNERNYQNRERNYQYSEPIPRVNSPRPMPREQYEPYYNNRPDSISQSRIETIGRSEDRTVSRTNTADMVQGQRSRSDQFLHIQDMPTKSRMTVQKQHMLDQKSKHVHNSPDIKMQQSGTYDNSRSREPAVGKSSQDYLPALRKDGPRSMKDQRPVDVQQGIHDNRTSALVENVIVPRDITEQIKTVSSMIQESVKFMQKTLKPCQANNDGKKDTNYYSNDSRANKVPVVGITETSQVTTNSKQIRNKNMDTNLFVNNLDRKGLHNTANTMTRLKEKPQAPMKCSEDDSQTNRTYNVKRSKEKPNHSEIESRALNDNSTTVIQNICSDEPRDGRDERPIKASGTSHERKSQSEKENIKHSGNGRKVIPGSTTVPNFHANGENSGQAIKSDEHQNTKFSANMTDCRHQESFLSNKDFITNSDNNKSERGRDMRSQPHRSVSATENIGKGQSKNCTNKDKSGNCILENISYQDKTEMQCKEHRKEKEIDKSDKHSKYQIEDRIKHHTVQDSKNYKQVSDINSKGQSKQKEKDYTGKHRGSYEKGQNKHQHKQSNIHENETKRPESDTVRKKDKEHTLTRDTSAHHSMENKTKETSMNIKTNRSERKQNMIASDKEKELVKHTAVKKAKECVKEKSRYNKLAEHGKSARNDNEDKHKADDDCRDDRNNATTENPKQEKPHHKCKSSGESHKHKFVSRSHEHEASSEIHEDKSSNDCHKHKSSSEIHKQKSSSEIYKHKTSIDIHKHNSLSESQKHKSSSEGNKHKSSGEKHKQMSSSDSHKHKSSSDSHKHKSSSDSHKHRSSSDVQVIGGSETKFKENSKKAKSGLVNVGSKERHSHSASNKLIDKNESKTCKETLLERSSNIKQIETGEKLSKYGIDSKKSKKDKGEQNKDSRSNEDDKKVKDKHRHWKSETDKVHSKQTIGKTYHKIVKDKRSFSAVEKSNNLHSVPNNPITGDVEKDDLSSLFGEIDACLSENSVCSNLKGQSHTPIVKRSVSVESNDSSKSNMNMESSNSMDSVKTDGQTMQCLRKKNKNFSKLEERKYVKVVLEKLNDKQINQMQQSLKKDNGKSGKMKPKKMKRIRIMYSESSNESDSSDICRQVSVSQLKKGVAVVKSSEEGSSKEKEEMPPETKSDTRERKQLDDTFQNQTTDDQEELPDLKEQTLDGTLCAIHYQENGNMRSDNTFVPEQTKRTNSVDSNCTTRSEASISTAGEIEEASLPKNSEKGFDIDMSTSMNVTLHADVQKNHKENSIDENIDESIQHKFGAIENEVWFPSHGKHKRRISIKGKKTNVDREKKLQYLDESQESGEEGDVEDNDTSFVRSEIEDDEEHCLKLSVPEGKQQRCITEITPRKNINLESSDIVKDNIDLKGITAIEKGKVVEKGNINKSMVGSEHFKKAIIKEENIKKESDNKIKIEIPTETDASIKDEPDWSTLGYTQDVILLSDDDDDFGTSLSQPVINLDSDSDGEVQQLSGTVKIKTEAQDWSDADSSSSDVKLLDLGYDFSTTDNESDLGSDFEPEVIFGPDVLSKGISIDLNTLESTDIKTTGAEGIKDLEMDTYIGDKNVSFVKKEEGFEKPETNAENDFSSSGDEILLTSAFDDKVKCKREQIDSTVYKSKNMAYDVKQPDGTRSYLDDPYAAATQVTGHSSITRDALSSKSVKIEAESENKQKMKENVKKETRSHLGYVYDQNTDNGPVSDVNSDIDIFDYQSEHIVNLTQTKEIGNEYQTETQAPWNMHEEIIEISTDDDERFTNPANDLNDFYQNETQAPLPLNKHYADDEKHHNKTVSNLADNLNDIYEIETQAPLILNRTDGDDETTEDSSSYEDPQLKVYIGTKQILPSFAGKLGIKLDYSLDEIAGDVSEEDHSEKIDPGYLLQTQAIGDPGIDDGNESSDAAYNIATQIDVPVDADYNSSSDNELENQENISEPLEANEQQLKDLDSDYDDFNAETQIDIGNLLEIDTMKTVEMNDDRYDILTQRETNLSDENNSETLETDEKQLKDLDSDYDDFNAETQIDTDNLLEIDAMKTVEMNDDRYDILTQIGHVKTTAVEDPYIAATQLAEETDNKWMDSRNERTKQTANVRSTLKRPLPDKGIPSTSTMSGPSSGKKPRTAIAIDPQPLKSLIEKRNAGIVMKHTGEAKDTDKVHGEKEVGLPNMPPPRSEIFILKDASRKDMWLSKDSGRTHQLSEKGQPPKKRRKRSKSTEKADANLEAKMQEARSRLKERNFQSVVHPESIAEPAKRFKHPAPVMPSEELEDAYMPTSSQIVRQGLPLINDTGLLLKKPSAKTNKPSAFVSRAAAHTETISNTADKAVKTSSVSVTTTTTTVSRTSATTSVSGSTTFTRPQPSTSASSNKSTAGKQLADKYFVSSVRNENPHVHDQTKDKKVKQHYSSGYNRPNSVNTSKDKQQRETNSSGDKSSGSSRSSKDKTSELKEKQRESNSSRDKQDQSASSKYKQRGSNSSRDNTSLSSSSKDRHESSSFRDKTSVLSSSKDKHGSTSSWDKASVLSSSKDRYEPSSSRDKASVPSTYRDKHDSGISGEKHGGSSSPSETGATRDRQTSASSSSREKRPSGSEFSKDKQPNGSILSRDNGPSGKSAGNSSDLPKHVHWSISTTDKPFKESKPSSNQSEHRSSSKDFNPNIPCCPKGVNSSKPQHIHGPSPAASVSSNTLTRDAHCHSTHPPYGRQTSGSGHSNRQVVENNRKKPSIGGQTARQLPREGQTTAFRGGQHVNLMLKPNPVSAIVSKGSPVYSGQNWTSPTWTAPMPGPSGAASVFQNQVQEPSTLTWDIFLSVILKWNPLWLDEKVQLDSVGRSFPPDVTVGLCGEGPASLYPLVERYQSFKEYSENFMLPLLLYETWESCFKTWSEKKSRGQICRQKLLLNQQGQSGQKNMVFHLLGIYNQSDRRNGRGFKEGDLVHVKVFQEQETAELPKQWMDVMGYIEKVEYTNQRTDRLCQQNPEFAIGLKPDSLVMKMTLKLRKRKMSPSSKHLIELKDISTIVTTRRQFLALLALSRSPLCKDILRPDNNLTYCDRAPASIQQLQVQYNRSQSEAINTAAKIAAVRREEPRICLLQGPPGTGKSHTIIGIIEKMLKVRKQRSPICLCAPSNAAVDELLRRLHRQNKSRDKNLAIKFVRLGKKSSIHPEIQHFSLDSITEKNLQQAKREELRKSLPASLQEEIDSLQKKIEAMKQKVQNSKDIYQKQKCRTDQKDLEKRLADIERRYMIEQKHIPVDPKAEREMRKKLLIGANVIGGTLSSFGSSQIRNYMYQVGFECVIIDEATQAIELDSLIPLQYGTTKLILVGDPEQLPPTVQSQEAKDNKLDLSLFERLYNYFSFNIDSHHKPVMLLDTQYRMHPEIAEFPKSYIYEGKLLNSSSVVDRRGLGLEPYLLYDIHQGQEQFSQTSKSMSNEAEAIFTAELCHFIVTNAGVVEKAIGVIAPYAKQKEKIVAQLERRGHRDIEVSTVDGFQGREKLIIMMSCVRANDSGNVGFVGSRKRMNVALTRAKYAMYLVGNFESLESSNEWKALIDNAKQRKKVIQVSEDNMRPAISRCQKLGRP